MNNSQQYERPSSSGLWERKKATSEQKYGKFYDDLYEETGIFAQTELGRHVDTILRVDLGIIRQTGSFGKKDAVSNIKRSIQTGTKVHNNPRLGNWVLTAHPSAPLPSDSSINYEKDEIPKGVIYIVGEIEFHTFKQLTASETSMASVTPLTARSMVKNQRWIQSGADRDLLTALVNKNETEDYICSGYLEIQRTETKDLEYSFQEDIHNLVNATDATDTSYISSKALVRYFQQYVIRSIIRAASTKGALIVHHGTQGLMRCLHLGCVARGTHGGVQILNTVDEFPNPVERDLFSSNFRYFSHVLEVLRGKQKPSQNLSEDAEYLTYNLVDWLVKGFDPRNKFNDKTTGKQPPARPRIPSCIVLFGGQKYHRTMIRAAVDKSWPIVVIEGSGGFADEICEVHRKLTEFRVNQASNAQEKFETLDQECLNIVNYHNFHLIPKGKKPEEVERILERVLESESMIHLCWYKYTKWRFNASQNRRVYEVSQIAMLVLQITTTVFAILMTFFLLVRGTNVPPTDPESVDADSFKRLWQFMQMTVITLPILVTLLQAVLDMDKPGNKWVTLMMASSEVAREIYFYRSRSEKYESSELAKQVSIQDNGQNVLCSTRDELIHYRMKAITEKLLNSEITEDKLAEPPLPIAPPKDILELGDDGFSDLTPDQYIKFRLKPCIERYERDAKMYGKWKTALTIIVYVWGALGTGFAALATYVDGSFQAFVSISTAVVNAVTRYLEYTRVEWLQKRYNQTRDLLTHVDAVWKSRGSSTYTSQEVQDNYHKAKNELVMFAEAAIMQEVNESSTQLGEAIQQSKKMSEELAKERENLLKDAKAGTKTKDQNEMAMIKSGLKEFTPDNIAKALKNTNGPEAETLKAALILAQKKMAEEVDKAAPVAGIIAKTEFGRAVGRAIDPAVNVIKDIVMEGKELFNKVKKSYEDNVPASIRSVLQDNVERKKVLSALVAQVGGDSTEAARLGSHLMAEMAQKAGSALGFKIAELAATSDQRKLLEVMKAVAVSEMVSEFFHGKNSKDIALLESALITDQCEMETFISEMQALAKVPQMQTVDHTSLLNSIRDPNLKDRLSKLGSEVTGRVLHCASVNFAHATKEAFNGAMGILRSTAESIADLYVEELFNSKKDSVKVWRCVKRLKEITLQEEAPDHSKIHLEAMGRDDLLSLLYSSFKDESNDVVTALGLDILSQFQLVKFLRALTWGTPGSRVWDSFAKRNPQLPGLFISPGDDPAVVYECADRLVMCSQYINQMDINILSKGSIIRKLRTCEVFDDSLQSRLQNMNESDLKTFLSTLQYSISNSFAGRIIDNLSDLVTTVDLHSLITVSTRENFVFKAGELLKNISYDQLCVMTKQQLLQAFGFKDLVKMLETLDEDSVRDVVTKLQFILTHSFMIQSVKDFQYPAEFKSLYRDLFNTFSSEFFFHLVGACSSDNYIRECLADPSRNLKDEIKALGDVYLQTPLRHFKTDIDLRILFDAVCQSSGEFILNMVFENVNYDIDHIEHFAILSDSPLYTTSQSRDRIQSRIDTAFERSFKMSRDRDSLVRSITRICTMPMTSIKQQKLIELRTTQMKFSMMPFFEECAQLDKVLNHDDTKTEVQLTEFDKSAEMKIYAATLSELTTSLPYLIFLKCCNLCQNMDLRDVVSDVSLRYSIVFWVYELLRMGKMYTYFNEENVESSTPYEVQPPILRLSIKDNADKRNFFSRIAESSKIDSNDFLRLDGTLSSISVVAQSLTPEQLCEFFSVMYSVLFGTLAGQFFVTYEYLRRSEADRWSQTNPVSLNAQAVFPQALRVIISKSDSPLIARKDRNAAYYLGTGGDFALAVKESQYPRETWNTYKLVDKCREYEKTLFFIKRRMRLHPKDVSAMFEQFDCSLFIRKPLPDKMKILSILVESDEICREVGQFGSSILDVFWSHVSISVRQGDARMSPSRMMSRYREVQSMNASRLRKK